MQGEQGSVVHYLHRKDWLARFPLASSSLRIAANSSTPDCPGIVSDAAEISVKNSAMLQGHRTAKISAGSTRQQRCHPANVIIVPVSRNNQSAHSLMRRC